ATHGVGSEESELTRLLGRERGGGNADEAHRLRERLARQQGRRAAIELEALLRRVAGVASCERAEVGETQLERDAPGRQPLRAQLARDALGLTPQRRVQPCTVRRVTLERRLGAHRLRRRPRLDGPPIAAQGQVLEARALAP